MTQVEQLAPGDTLLLYTDGLVEASNEDDIEFGPERLATVAAGSRHLAPAELVGACRAALGSFLGPAAPKDDLTIMAVRRR